MENFEGKSKINELENAFNSAKNADYLAGDMGLDPETRGRIEIKQDVNHIYIKYKETGQLSRYFTGGVSPRFLAQEVQKKFQKDTQS